MYFLFFFDELVLSYRYLSFEEFEVQLNVSNSFVLSSDILTFRFGIIPEYYKLV